MIVDSWVLGDVALMFSMTRSNHLESLIAKDGSSYAISELKKESDITSKMLDIIQKDEKLKQANLKYRVMNHHYIN